jgi:hypothetical protein
MDRLLDCRLPRPIEADAKAFRTFGLMTAIFCTFLFIISFNAAIFTGWIFYT